MRFFRRSLAELDITSATRRSLNGHVTRCPKITNERLQLNQYKRLGFYELDKRFLKKDFFMADKFA